MYCQGLKNLKICLLNFSPREIFHVMHAVPSLVHSMIQQTQGKALTVRKMIMVLIYRQGKGKLAAL